ncbi:Clavaminate synthase-like protein [Coemansia reversa NRRL 1564]|uniref:Clavaminate synthase-like protein n=1 Tax=Coemansia reversa (strain ATCC 12441 / NRRL 1564) TaxID=763665 RepID=A0A2G5BH37_COERN|nr:Clavaminate synthase-like protein [Coemansia reversa NRRL 1564]|eukprot:PIA18323.1 Clavaminate synthase-like protein [Coemansia reversa NRRL 1564]
MISDPKRSCPFIIEDAISFWPAFSQSKWSNLDYMRQTAGHYRLVPIEHGKKYTDEQWTQKLIPFGEFLDSISNSSGKSDNPCYYLAQHNLLKQAPALNRDFVLPDYTQVETGRRTVPVDAADNLDGVIVNIWIGPSETVSPLHYDVFDNVFAQIFGYKYFRLYSHRETPNLYPHSSESLLANTSQIDVESPDIEKYPRSTKAQYLECVVKPGDLLYIPPRWWHYVRSLSTSSSISMWF